MSCDTSFLMFRLALSNYVPFESDDDMLDLCQDEMEGAYKAILYVIKNGRISVGLIIIVRKDTIQNFV